MSISFNMVANGSVPATGATPGAIYFELNGAGTGFNLYNTPANGVPIKSDSVNTADVQTLIDTSLADFDSDVIVADIAARDALSLTRNATVHVVDASADSTVASGAATYLYNETADTFTKVSEFESLDVPLLDYTSQAW